MNYIFITALLDLKIKGVLSNPVKITENTFLTNNSNHIEKFLKQNARISIGSIETGLLLNGSPVIFRELDVDGVPESHIELQDFFRDALAFLTALWMFKDNSVNFELGFAISQKKLHIHSNSMAFHYWTKTGEKDPMLIDQDLLGDVASKCFNNFRGIKTKDEPVSVYQQKSTSRLNVAVSLLQQARSTSDLGVKIANYCSFFESILSTSSSELSHQMAERAAFFLRNKPTERLAHYKRSKRAYAVRSKIVHGDKISNGQLKDILDIADHCDEMARELLSLSLDNKEFNDALKSNSNDDLDNLMLNKIFGIDNVISIASGDNREVV